MLMATCMKENGLTTRPRVKELIVTQTVLITRAPGLKISSTDKVLRAGQTVLVTKDNTLKAKRRVMAD
jgi:hypothetical protein